MVIAGRFSPGTWVYGLLPSMDFVPDVFSDPTTDLQPDQLTEPAQSAAWLAALHNPPSPHPTGKAKPHPHKNIVHLPPSSSRMQGRGRLSATALITHEVLKVGVPGRGNLSATARVSLKVDVPMTLPGSGVLLVVVRSNGVVAAPHGRGVLSGLAKPTAAVNTAGHGVLSAITQVSSIPLRGRGTLSATLTPKINVAVRGRGVFSSPLLQLLAAPIRGRGVLSATATARFTPSAALPGRGALTATVKAKISVGPHGRGVLTVLAQSGLNRVATLHGAGVLTAAARMFSIRQPASLHGAGALTASATAKFARPAATSGAGLLSAAAQRFQIQSAAALPGKGTLTAATTVKAPVSAAAPGQGVLSATVRLYSINMAVTLPGRGTLSATATIFQIQSNHGFPYIFPFILNDLGTALPGKGTLTAVIGNRSNAALPGQGVLSATAFSAAVTLDSVGGGSQTRAIPGSPTPATITISWTHTMLAGSNTAVVCFLTVGPEVAALNSSNFTTTVTFGGTPMASLGTWNSGSVSGTTGYLQAFVIYNPPVGTQTVTVSVLPNAADTNWLDLIGNTVAYMHTPGPVNVNNVAYITSGNTPTTTSASSFGDVVVCGLASGAAEAGWNQTVRYTNNFNANTGVDNLAICDAAPSATGVGFPYTFPFVLTPATGTFSASANAAPWVLVPIDIPVTPPPTSPTNCSAALPGKAKLSATAKATKFTLTAALKASGRLSANAAIPDPGFNFSATFPLVL